MKIERKPFLEALETVKPAISAKDMVEELTCAWFDGETVMAYNDAELGIQAPLKTPFVGGLRGSLIMGLLSKSRAKQISLEPTDDEAKMILKAGHTRAELMLLESERSVWQFPEMNDKAAVKLSGAFLNALGSVLVSVGKDMTTPESLGVTIYFEDQDATLFATDSATIAMSLSSNAKSKKKNATVILPTVFCEQVMRLCGDGGLMEVRDDCVIVKTDGDILLYSRLIDSAKPLDFWGVLDSHAKWPKGAEFAIPDRLGMALERMEVLFDGLPDEPMTVLIQDGVMRLSAKVDGRGELNEKMEVPKSVPSVKLKTVPRLLKRALPLVNSMVCTNEAVRMHGDGEFVYLVANTAV